MRIGIVTNINAGKGLTVDAELLRDFLFAHGHEITLIQYNEPHGEKYDLLIFLETITSEMTQLAPRSWYFANPEWLKPEYVRSIQRYCEKVFVKTRDGERALKERFSNVHYVGFLTRDKRDSTVPRERKFLHLGGNGGFRNTPAVIEAWRSYRYWVQTGGEMGELTVVSNSILTPLTAQDHIHGITYHSRVSDEEVTRLQNSHLFHVLPSAYEGWGQALHEAQSVGAVLLTTVAGPMAELHAPFEVSSIRSKRNNLGVLQEVSPGAIREKVNDMLTQPNTVIARMQTEARLRFEKGQEEFKEAFLEHLSPKITCITRKPTIALLGNFHPPHSTENDLLWTLRDMGHPVITFQENETRTEEVVDGCKLRAKLLIWVHTHGWDTPGEITLDEMLAKLKANGTRTCSFHLDKYFGLNQLDQRENKIGAHPFWHTETVFTADGGNDVGFKQRNINHRWLPPGFVKRDATPGTFRAELASDVGFVGSVSYHPEYAFRGELISFLQAVYADRFRIYQGVRGEALNDVYASCKVVVGDSCFGGADYYWSDRVPETLGRSGFLLHPASRGLVIPGLVTFEPGNLAELQDKIDWFLAHEEERLASVKVSSAWCKEHENYHNRMETLLKEML